MMLMTLDMAVKGLLVLSAAAATARFLRAGSAATRYLVWSTGVAGLLLLPVVAALVPVWHSPTLPDVPREWLHGEQLEVFDRPFEEKSRPMTAGLLRPTPRAPIVLAPAPKGASETRETLAPAVGARMQASPSQAPIAAPAFALPAWLAVLAGLYLIVALALLARLVIGAIGVLRIVRGARSVVDRPLRLEFEQAVAELDIRRPVDLLESDATSVPVAWELLHPVVLLPAGADGWPSARRRVALLHELAHVSRRDCQVQLAGQVALALHWFNPLAWLAVRRLRIEREHACDDRVLSLGTRASDYAEHLLHIARGLVQSHEPAWASVAMARQAHLEGRVAAILDPHHSRRLPQRRTTMIALITAFALLLPLAALQPGAQAQSQQYATDVPEHQAATHPPETDSHLSLLAAHLRDAAAHVFGATAHVTGMTEHVAAAHVQDTEPTIDGLVQMRIHGVSVEFIEEVRAAFGRPVTVGELVQMRIHGTTPEFVAAMSEVFPDEEVTIQNVTQMRIHGASIDFIREMKSALGGDLSTRDITQMRIHGATVDFVRTMRELLPDEEVTARDVTQMRIHGVTVEMVRDLREDGYEDLTVQDLVQMRIHGFDRWLQRRNGGR